ncbi:MAG TPA: bifunctional 5,10-methylenetetrahydrofolate dehydrogenase/5,10-methenyltetrahydrofolate cyclohydrolase [Candidatus Saccharimonadales bacterium]
MTKLLNGAELVGYIQERQARQVRALRQASRVFPRLVIIKSMASSSVIDTYVRMKQRYGEEILVETVVETLNEVDMPSTIKRLNADPLVHGIIVQLPLADPAMTDVIVDAIAPEKDVDGLGQAANYDSATATAINWLLSGYGIDLRDKAIAIVGQGRLVGAPLAKMWQASGYNVTIADINTEDVGAVLRQSDVVVTATGVPGLIKSDMIQIGATVVDAGTASEDGVIVGDVEPSLRERDDVTITPAKGGVGPLTIAALCDNVIQAATRIAEAKK